MSLHVIVDDGDTSDSDSIHELMARLHDPSYNPETDDVLLTFVRNHQIGGTAGVEIGLCEILLVPAELIPPMMGNMVPRGLAVVVKPLRKMQDLISHYAANMAQLVKWLTAWIKAHQKETVLILTGIIFLALCVAMPAILGAIGFGAQGPIIGSMAAAWQASIGSVAAGSLFSFLQAAAMGGAAMGFFTGVGVLGGVIAVGGALATVKVVKEQCGEAIEKSATVMKDGFEQVKAGAGTVWRNSRNWFLKKTKHHDE